MSASSDLEKYLRTARIIEVAELPYPGGGGHPDKRLVVLEGAVGAVAKLFSAKTPDSALMLRCEVAAWRVAKLLGWTDLVAATVLREIPVGGGEQDTESSMQVVWPAFVSVAQLLSRSISIDPTYLDASDRWRAAIFDSICRNTDRNEGNWGVVDGTTCVRLIDHGYAFCDWPGRTFNSPFAAHCSGPISDAHRQSVSRLVGAVERSGIPELATDPTAVHGILHRGRHIVQQGALPPV